MFHRTPAFLPVLFPSLIWRIPTKQKELYLTFDDGPIPGPTEFALETLSYHNVKATFFCIGDNIHKHPSIFQEIVKRDHSVGNHTHNHLNGWKTPVENYITNVQRCQDQIESGISNFERNIESETSAFKPFFRPPYGCITFSQIKLLNHFRIVMWDVLSIDYNKNLSPDACLKNTINACRPGSIIVFHDSLKAERNMMFVLPRLIEHFSAKGFVFKSLL